MAANGVLTGSDGRRTENAGQAAALEAERLHALIDGLAVHTALCPDPMKPEQIVAVVRLHLDALDNTSGLAQPEQTAVGADWRARTQSLAPDGVDRAAGAPARD